MPPRLSNKPAMKLSLVTINRNNAAGLARTLRSVFEGQLGFEDFEQIVIDGASTDGSQSIVESFRADTRLAAVVSESDEGICDAMDKGASLAQGEFLSLPYASAFAITMISFPHHVLLGGMALPRRQGSPFVFGHGNCHVVFRHAYIPSCHMRVTTCGGNSCRASPTMAKAAILRSHAGVLGGAEPLDHPPVHGG